MSVIKEVSFIPNNTQNHHLRYTTYIYKYITCKQRLYAKQDEVFIGTHLKSQVNAMFCCANSKKHKM